MNATTVAVDLAKNVFELAVADSQWRVFERHRLTRFQFERWFDNREVGKVVMEACGSAHYWARRLRERGDGGVAAAAALRARVCEAQQDRGGRCAGAAGGGALERYQAGGGEVGRAATATDSRVDLLTAFLLFRGRIPYTRCQVPSRRILAISGLPYSSAYCKGVRSK